MPQILEGRKLYIRQIRENNIQETSDKLERVQFLLLTDFKYLVELVPYYYAGGLVFMHIRQLLERFWEVQRHLVLRLWRELAEELEHARQVESCIFSGLKVFRVYASLEVLADRWWVLLEDNRVLLAQTIDKLAVNLGKSPHAIFVLQNWLSELVKRWHDFIQDLSLV